MRLLTFAKHADGVVLLTPAARIGAITLSRNQHESIPTTEGKNPTFDFFSLHLSQALHTRLRALASVESMECLEGDDIVCLKMLARTRYLRNRKRGRTMQLICYQRMAI